MAVGVCARALTKWHMIKVNKKYYFKVEQLQIFKCVVGRTENKNKIEKQKPK